MVAFQWFVRLMGVDGNRLVQRSIMRTTWVGRRLLSFV